MEFTQLITFAIACFFIAVVPGPSITVIVANALRGGMPAGLATMAGTQLGVFTIILVVGLSLNSIVVIMAEAFVWIKLLGAAYLIWLGISLFRSGGHLVLGDDEQARRKSRSGYFWQGFLVIWSNPKALIFLGAFIPQFVNYQSNPFGQVMALGLLFMVMTTIIDGCYSLIAAKAGSMLTKRRVSIVEKVSGSFLVGGGVWLATLKSQ